MFLDRTKQLLLQGTTPVSQIRTGLLLGDMRFACLANSDLVKTGLLRVWRMLLSNHVTGEVYSIRLSSACLKF